MLADTANSIARAETDKSKFADAPMGAFARGPEQSYHDRTQYPTVTHVSYRDAGPEGAPSVAV